MITVNKGTTLLSGSAAEITQDFCSVMQALMEEAPEILVAVSAKYADDTCALLHTNISPTRVAILGDIASEFREHNKENREDD